MTAARVLAVVAALVLVAAVAARSSKPTSYQLEGYTFEQVRLCVGGGV